MEKISNLWMQNNRKCPLKGQSRCIGINKNAYTWKLLILYRTALHIACASGHVDVVQFLVESKAKLNLCDNQNRSALMKVILIVRL